MTPSRIEDARFAAGDRKYDVLVVLALLLAISGAACTTQAVTDLTLAEITAVNVQPLDGPAVVFGQKQVLSRDIRLSVRTESDLAKLKRGLSLHVHGCHPRHMLAGSFLYFRTNLESRERVFPPINPDDLVDYEKFQELSVRRGYFEYVAYIPQVLDTARTDSADRRGYNLRDKPEELCIRLYGPGMVDSITSNWVEVDRRSVERATRVR